METKSEFSILGLAHKICLAAENQGYNPQRLNDLAEHPDLFRRFLQVQLCLAEIKPIEHLIDLDANPFTPSGWRVEEHAKGGHFKWNPTQVKLHLSKSQKDGKVIEGNRLRGEL